MSQPASEPLTTSTRQPLDLPARRKVRFDNRYIAPLFITFILLVGHLSYGILESYRKTALAIVAALLTELILGRIFFGKWLNLASAYITGISVGILVRSPAYWPYALCSVISIMSKYVLRVKGRHIWNPSNFGIAVLLFLAADTMAVLSIQWGNNYASLLVIWISAQSLFGGRGAFTLAPPMSSRFSSWHSCAAGLRVIPGRQKSRRSLGRCINCSSFS